MSRLHDAEARVGREFFQRGSIRIIPIYTNPNRKKYEGKNLGGRKRRASYNAVEVVVFDTSLPRGNYMQLGVYTRLRDFKADFNQCKSNAEQS